MIFKLLGYILGICLFGVCLSLDNRRNNRIPKELEEPIEYVTKDHIKCTHAKWDTLSKEEKSKIMYVEFTDCKDCITKY